MIYSWPLSPDYESEPAILVSFFQEFFPIHAAVLINHLTASDSFFY